MSMKISAAGNGFGLLLIAALIIGCGNSESNTTERAGEAERGASAGEGGYASGEPGQGGQVSGGAAASSPPGGAAASSPPARVAAAQNAPAAAAPPTVLFVGTSLTAGAGLAEEQSFPLLIERRIDEAGLPYRVVNAGVSGETSAGALARIDWLLQQPFDVVVLETGANDMLRGIDPAATEQNIEAIVDRIRSVAPDAPILLAGMLAVPNLGDAYRREFEAIYPRVAERNGLPLVPFLLEGVAGERHLNQSDGVHPTAEGQEVVAGTVWAVLEPILAEQMN